MPFLKGHFWCDGVRQNIVGLGGPVRCPLRQGDGVQECFVWDPKGRGDPPPDRRRGVAMPRTTKETWDALVVEGNKATGGHTAKAMVLMAGYMVAHDEARAGGGDSIEVENITKLLAWLRRWRRGLLPRVHDSGHGRRAGGGDGDPLCGALGEARGARPTRRVVWWWGEGLWASDSEDEEDFGAVGHAEQRAGGRRPSLRPNAQEVQASSFVQGSGEAVRPFAGDVGHRVEEWLEENLSGYLAPSTVKQYSSVHGKWKAWARRQQWPSEFLCKGAKVEENEDKLLGFLGYIGWLGASVATMKQVVFAIKDAHKRFGHGNPTQHMHRLWMLLNALERRYPKKARRLGVTPAMLKWIAKTLRHGSGQPGDLFDAMMLVCALLTAWFFMLRAKEYCDSNGIDEGMILRGTDLKFVEEDGEGIVGVTLQFRKTKTDQDAFGTCKTMYKSGVDDVCVVSALQTFREMAPQRFGQGCEALRPLFRWSGGQVLKRSQVQNVLQRAATAVGLPPERFRSHSLRIGGASAMFQATGEIELVKRTGRWSSSAVQRYLHDGEVALKGVASKMANVEQKIHYT